MRHVWIAAILAVAVAACAGIPRRDRWTVGRGVYTACALEVLDGSAAPDGSASEREVATAECLQDHLCADLPLDRRGRCPSWVAQWCPTECSVTRRPWSRGYEPHDARTRTHNHDYGRTRLRRCASASAGQRDDGSELRQRYTIAGNIQAEEGASTPEGPTHELTRTPWTGSAFIPMRASVLFFRGPGGDTSGEAYQWGGDLGRLFTRRRDAASLLMAGSFGGEAGGVVRGDDGCAGTNPGDDDACIASSGTNLTLRASAGLGVSTNTRLVFGMLGLGDFGLLSLSDGTAECARAGSSSGDCEMHSDGYTVPGGGAHLVAWIRAGNLPIRFLVEGRFMRYGGDLDTYGVSAGLDLASLYDLAVRGILHNSPTGGE